MIFAGFMNKLLITLTFLFLAYTSYGQQFQVIINVEDENKELLIGAVVSLGPHNAITDEMGHTAMDVEDGVYPLQISFLGYVPYVDTIQVVDHMQLNVQLSPSTAAIDEVVVTSDRLERELSAASTGYLGFSGQSLESVPMLFGEQDFAKYLKTQAGVLSGSDGNNGYYVRGGGIDQNLVRLDNMELYNVNHLLGLFSMFNGQAIDRYEFVRSGAKANHGRRLSSFMNVKSKRPDLDQFGGEAGVGLLAASAKADIPLIRNRSGLMLAMRRSYIDVFTQNLFSDSSQIKKRTDYRFSDMMVKYHHVVDDRNQFSLTVFFGSDEYDFTDSEILHSSMYWQTQNAGLTWRHLGQNNSDFEMYFTLGNYRQVFESNIVSYALNFGSSINDVSHGFSYHKSWVDKVFLTTGYELIGRRILPNRVRVSSGEDQFELNATKSVPSLEGAIFGDVELQLTRQLTAGVGLRSSHFAQLGPYDEILDPTGVSIEDTISYSTNEVVHYYQNLEPRLRLNYALSSRILINASFDQNAQYIHLSPVSSISLPVDVWVPSTRLIRPQLSKQFALGANINFLEESLTLSTLGYFKQMQHQIEYRNGVILGQNESNNFDEVFVAGDGNSKGLEVSLNKSEGRLQGQINYTLSRTTRRLENVNRGNYFPAKYDRTHDLNVVVQYEMGNWEFSALFKYATGSALTLPVAKYVIGGNLISEYLGRNSLRMPPYHRLDVSAMFNPENKPNSQWIFSVYNLYNRQNPYFMFFDVSGEINQRQVDVNLKGVSLFPILPSVTYRFKF